MEIGIDERTEWYRQVLPVPEDIATEERKSIITSYSRNYPNANR